MINKVLLAFTYFVFAAAVVVCLLLASDGEDGGLLVPTREPEAVDVSLYMGD